MRGILECWIKQAHRVELFKQRQSNLHALHCKFHLHTGEEIYSDDLYNHLQIDAVSIYIIFLVQMITSGLQIIYTQVIPLELVYLEKTSLITCFLCPGWSCIRSESCVLRWASLPNARFWYVGKRVKVQRWNARNSCFVYRYASLNTYWYW